MKHIEPGWLDRQYDNRANVPEHPDILVRWAESSALTRSRMNCELDVPYGDSAAETLDLFPAAQPGSPVLVFIHGGYWRALDKRDHSFVAPAFVNAGAAVVVPNYGLCPAVDIPTIAVQMARAVAWTRRHATRFGGDPRHIVVAGHSAGGHLATMLLCCDWQRIDPDLPAGLVRCALSISGLYDLDPVRRVRFLQNDLRLDDEQVNRLSPTGFPAPQRGRLLTAVGADETDEFRRQNALMQAAWGEAAVPQVLEVAASNHFTVLHAFVDAASPLHQMALEALGLAATAINGSTATDRSDQPAQFPG